MKILLVCPQENMPQSVEVYPSGALLLLGSMLHERGHEVSVVQMITDRIDETGIERRVRDWKPDIVGITMNTFQTRSAREVSRAVKRVSRRILVVAGGPHPSALKLETLRIFPDIDVVVLGEGEETFMDIVEGVSLSTIPGICFDGTMTPPRPFVKTFDHVPLTNLDLVGGREGIKRYRGAYPCLPVPSMFIMGSRGCFGRCKFCNTPVFWGPKVRTREPDAILKEIESLHRAYGIKDIFFTDDTSNANKPRLETILNLIIERGLNRDISYRCSLRVNEKLVTPELLRLAKRANVWEIFYGTESGNQAMLSSMGKNVSIGEIERAFRLTREAGIKCVTNFLIGNPGETWETMNDSLRLALRLKPWAVGFTIVIPFPRTALREELQEQGMLIEENYDMYTPERCLMRIAGLTHEDIQEFRNYASHRMMLQPSNIDYLFHPSHIFGVRSKLRTAKSMLLWWWKRRRRKEPSVSTDGKRAGNS